jgi:hypothetical protein
LSFDRNDGAKTEEAAEIPVSTRHNRRGMPVLAN